MPNIPTLLRFAATAALEGWTFIEQSRGDFAGRIMIASDSTQGRFECDVDAEQFVRIQAANGSKIHIEALSLHRQPALFA